MDFINQKVLCTGQGALKDIQGAGTLPFAESPLQQVTANTGKLERQEYGRGIDNPHERKRLGRPLGKIAIEPGQGYQILRQVYSTRCYFQP
jgi:hypothetical protein